MLIEKEFDKEYPELPECEVNDRDCEFEVSGVCHECGTPLCDSCSIGLRHQPQLVTYTYDLRGESKRQQLHCPDCFESHWINWQLVGTGGGSFALGAIVLYATQFNSIPLSVLAILLLAVGGWILYTEYLLKSPDHDDYGVTDLM